MPLCFVSSPKMLPPLKLLMFSVLSGKMLWRNKTGRAPYREVKKEKVCNVVVLSTEQLTTLVSIVTVQIRIV